ncbi:MAG: phosphoribosyltransferase [Candidatus Thermoplasmatota archaeon]|nr:phosphoribosyltransferase [Candidatus Thermoplasmatota archaeon]
MPKTVPARLVEWKEIVQWCSAIAEKVMDSDFRPDVIVGMARGGWVPSRLVCDELIVKNLISVKTQHWGMTATRDGKAVLSSGISENLQGKRVLIVDDITDTGESIRLAFEHVRSLGPEETKCAAMLHISHSKFVPDYYAEEVNAAKWKWFVFPWNYNEDMATFITGILSDSQKTLSEISELLRAGNSITLSEKQLLTTLLRFSKLGIVSRTGSLWHKN